jgi:hypothetical protein
MSLPAHANVSLTAAIFEIGARTLVDVVELSARTLAEVTPHFVELRKHRHTLQTHIRSLEIQLQSDSIQQERDRIQRYCDFYSSAISLSVSLEEKRMDLVKDHFLQMTEIASALMSEIYTAQHNIDQTMMNSEVISPARLSYMRRRQNDLQEEKQSWHLLVNTIDRRFLRALTETGTDTREATKTIRHLSELAFKSRG